jgi:CheY-like chemotaxis protein
LKDKINSEQDCYVKILIVEDNPMNLDLARDLLELAGYEVIQATTAYDGIMMAQQETPDLILMDIGLPGMDGLAATAILKQTEKTRNIPVIVLTAHAMQGDEQKAMDAGCLAYMSKPIDTRTFAQTITRHLKCKYKGS